jgi:hypothetical protein
MVCVFCFYLDAVPLYCYVVHRDIQRALECSFNESIQEDRNGVPNETLS